jgi:S1-C subfamily serine protease
MIYSQTGSNIGYGFAIPTSIVNKAVDDFKKYGSYQRAMIGIQGMDVKNYVDGMKDQDKDVQDFGTMEGIYVDKVVEDGAAADAGLQKGDVLTHIDGQKVKQFGELQAIIAQKRPGDKVKITYLRNKKEKTTTLTLKNEQGNTKVVKNADVDVLGIDVRPVTDSQKKQLEISYGLEVLKVNGGKMKEAGVPKGFIIQVVNDQPMRSFDDLQQVVKDAKDQMLVIKGIFPTGKRGGFVVYLQNE